TSAVRTFTAPAPIANSSFSYVYYPSKSRISRKVQRKNLAILRVSNNRILGIHYPSRSVVGILVHNEYCANLIRTLSSVQVDPLLDFSPINPTIISDDQYACLAIEEKTAIAVAKHNQRLVRSLPFIRNHISGAVAHFFLVEKLITEELLSHFL
ncbi:MAG: hypothetical protein EXX96DRAFT_462194, partial [Benjaminiella poitrasii]